MTNKEQIRNGYLAYLSEIVKYGDKNPRARVQNPMKYAKIPLVEGKEILDKTVWVWSDLHFFHHNIIPLSNRPYTTVNIMNEHLVANFNDCVGKNDVSIWVGDIGFFRDEWLNEIIDECNGYKILVVGNHDFNGNVLRKLNFDEIHLTYNIDFPEVSLVFTHHPWYSIPRPFINIHGHIHVGIDTVDSPRHINVNCEFHEYKPVNLKTIYGWAKSRALKLNNEEF